MSAGEHLQCFEISLVDLDERCAIDSVAEGVGRKCVQPAKLSLVIWELQRGRIRSQHPSLKLSTVRWSGLSECNRLLFAEEKRLNTDLRHRQIAIDLHGWC